MPTLPPVTVCWPVNEFPPARMATLGERRTSARVPDARLSALRLLSACHTPFPVYCSSRAEPWAPTIGDPLMTCPAPDTACQPPAPRPEICTTSPTFALVGGMKVTCSAL